MASNRREFFIQADKRSPLRRFWDQEVVWRANALYHNDALNLPVKIVTGSRMDDDVTPGRVAAAALAFTPFGRIRHVRGAKRMFDVTKGAEASTAAATQFFSKSAKESAEVLKSAKELASYKIPGTVIKEGWEKAGTIGATWNSFRVAASANQAAGHQISRLALGSNFGSAGGAAGIARWGADFVSSPLGLYLSYRLLKNPSDQAAADDRAAADNKAAGDRMSAREQFNKDVIEAVERRSDKVVLNDWLTRKLAAYDDANKNRVKTAYSEAQRSREKGDHSAESAEARTVAALASVDAANLATLMEGVDRESDAWKALRSDREKDIVARSEDQFMDRYGYDYSTGTAMRSGKDPAASARATKDFTEFLSAIRSTIPTNGVDEIRFMTGGQYGK